MKRDSLPNEQVPIAARLQSRRAQDGRFAGVSAFITGTVTNRLRTDPCPWWREGSARRFRYHAAIPKWLVRSCFGLGLLVVPALTGCGNAQMEAAQARVSALEERLEEIERSNGRVQVRFDDFDDRLALVEDRVETNRLAMERRGIARPLPVVVAAPRGAGETGLSSPPAYSPPASPYPVREERAVRGRIVLPNTSTREAEREIAAERRSYGYGRIERAPDKDDYERVTITEEDFARFVNDEGASPARSKTKSSTKGSGKSYAGRAKPPVTSEKLPVAVAGAPAASTTPSKTPVSEDNTGKSPMDLYKRGLARYRAGEYVQAFGDFKSYLTTNPPRDYRDNALYWLGECSFGQGRFEDAITYFNRVIKETPEGNKVPDSMLKASIAYQRLGKKSAAKQALYNLMETYPSTNAAKLASEKLKALD